MPKMSPSRSSVPWDNDVKRITPWFSSIRHLGFLVTFQWYWKVSKIHKGNQYYWLFRKDWEIFVAFFGSALWFTCYFLEIIPSYVTNNPDQRFPTWKMYSISLKAALKHQFSTISSQLLLPQGKFENFRLSTKQDNRYLEGILRYLENVCKF